jgi:glutaminase
LVTHFEALHLRLADQTAEEEHRFLSLLFKAGVYHFETAFGRQAQLPQFSGVAGKVGFTFYCAFPPRRLGSAP